MALVSPMGRKEAAVDPMLDETVIPYAHGSKVPPAPWWLSVAAGLGLGLGLLWLGCGVWGLIVGIQQGFDEEVLFAVYGGIPFGLAVSIAELCVLFRRSIRCARTAGVLWLGAGVISATPMLAFDPATPESAWVIVIGYVVLCLALGPFHLIYALGRSKPATTSTSEG